MPPWKQAAAQYQQAALARSQQERAEEQTWIAREREYSTEMTQASQAWKTRDVLRMKRAPAANQDDSRSLFEFV